MVKRPPRVLDKHGNEFDSGTMTMDNDRSLTACDSCFNMGPTWELFCNNMAMAFNGELPQKVLGGHGSQPGTEFFLTVVNEHRRVDILQAPRRNIIARIGGRSHF